MAEQLAPLRVEAVPGGYNHFQEDHPELVGKLIGQFVATV
jgi:hypothetical protein